MIDNGRFGGAGKDVIGQLHQDHQPAPPHSSFLNQWEGGVAWASVESRARDFQKQGKACCTHAYSPVLPHFETQAIRNVVNFVISKDNLVIDLILDYSIPERSKTYRTCLVISDDLELTAVKFDWVAIPGNNGLRIWIRLNAIIVGCPLLFLDNQYHPKKLK